MVLQTAVNSKLAFGLVGTFYDDSARRVAPYNLASTAGINPKIGCAFTSTANEGEAGIGGEGSFLGVLVSPHEYVIYSLTATLELPAGTIGQLCTFGHVIVAPTTSVAVGYVAAYDNATGEIAGYATAGDVPEGSTLIPNSRFIFVSGTAGQPAVLELGN